MRLSCAFIVRKTRPSTDGYDRMLFKWHESHDTYLRDVFLSDPIIGRNENVNKCCVNDALTQQGFHICDVIIFPICIIMRGFSVLVLPVDELMPVQCPSY